MGIFVTLAIYASLLFQAGAFYNLNIRKNSPPIPYSRYEILQCEMILGEYGETLRINLLVRDEDSTLKAKNRPFYRIDFSLRSQAAPIPKADTLKTDLTVKRVWLPLKSLWVRDVSDTSVSGLKFRRSRPLLNINYGKNNVLHVWDDNCAIK